MQTLQLSESAQEIQKDSICNLLKMAFQSLRMQRILTNQPNHGQQRVVYQTNLVLPKIKNLIGVQWQCKISQRLILINLKLNSACNFSFKLCQFLKNQPQIQQFTHLINNLNLFGSQGYFCFNQITGELVLKQKIANFRFLSSQLVLLKYFIRCIKKISKVFVEEIQQIIFYYKLCGITQTETQSYFQHQNHVPLVKQTQNIIYLKQCFQSERSKRNHSSKQAINTSNHISSYTQILSPGQCKNSSESQNKNKNKDNLNYKHELQTLLKDIGYRKMTETTHIVTGFKIKQVESEIHIASGGYSNVIFGIYRYLPQISIYGNSQAPQLVQLKDEEKTIKNGLVKKVSKSIKGEDWKIGKSWCTKGEDNISFENQCNFLVYIRNKVCPYIAQYYCKTETKTPFSDQQIYLDFYPDNLKESRQKEDTKLKIIEDVCFALLFLNEQKLIHRDLKQTNIMVDRYHRGKLIDFGSVANIRGSNNFQEKDDIVRSTQTYFYPYKSAVGQYPTLKQFMSSEDYYSHETFDLFSLGVILQNQFYLDQFYSQTNFLRNNLKLLSDKCRQINPQDRWTVQQVCIFLRHLLVFNQKRRQFWNFGFDPRFKAHELGNFYNGNGSYNQRSKASTFNKERQTIQNPK